MRNTRALIAVALALVPAVAAAQQASTPAAAPPAGQEAFGPAPIDPEYVPLPRQLFDFGFQATDVTGDRARYERYRDLRDGPVLNAFRTRRETSSHWLLEATGTHVGRRDQRLTGAVVLPGKLKLTGRWDQIPTWLSNSARTLFTGGTPDVLTINDNVQAQAAANTDVLGALVKTDAVGLDLKSRRYVGEGKLEYIATPELTFTQSFRFMDRNGTKPYGGSFGHGNFVETIAPVYHRLANWNGNGEFLRGPVLVRAGYVASFFHNDYESFTFDSPFRAVDATAGSSRGRSSLPPSNSMFGVNGLVSVKLPGRTRASAYVSAGMLKDASGTQILPQTINSATTNLVALPRTTVDGEGRTTAANLTFTSRPSPYVDINARFRTYKYDNRTPPFTAPQRVAYDNNPGTGGFTTEPFGITRRNLDVDLRVLPHRAVAAGVGYSRIEEDRTLRIYDQTTENVARVVFDSIGSPWFTLRTKFEHSQKRGTLDQEAFEEMIAAGEHPEMIQFDIAPRDRNRATVIASVMPIENVSLSVSAATGKDDYLMSLMGLRDNKHHVYSAGFDASPAEHATVSLFYTLEDYRALSRSRNGRNETFDDPNYDWSTNTKDRVHSLVGSVEIGQIAEKLDLSFSADVSRATSTYTYFAASALPRPEQLPDEYSRRARTTAEGLYWVTPRVGVGVTYWYERYRVNNLTMGEVQTPSLFLSNSLLLGYLYRPYTANTVWGRIVFQF